MCFCSYEKGIDSCLSVLCTDKIFMEVIIPDNRLDYSVSEKIDFFHNGREVTTWVDTYQWRVKWAKGDSSFVKSYKFMEDPENVYALQGYSLWLHRLFNSDEVTLEVAWRGKGMIYFIYDTRDLFDPLYENCGTFRNMVGDCH